MNASSNIDPFQLEVLKSCFDTIADDIALTLMRTSYSGIIRDSLDFSTAICDAEGQTLAQGVCTPMHLGSFYDAMRHIIRQYEGRIDEGDVFIANDPYTAEGQHLPDIYIVKPIFWEGRLAGWSTTVAHHSDVGGIVPGSNALGAVEIYQEGLRLPVLKFVEAGKPNQAVWDIIATNVRTPDKVIGDLQAQMAACTSGEREFQELFKRYGLETVLSYAEHLHDYAERLARAEIAEIPDGTYEFTDHIDGLGEDGEVIVLQLALTVAGDHVTVDWTGSSEMIKGGVNSTFPFTKACAYTALRSVMAADVPNCHGFTRAIDVVAPEGTVVRPVHPGPTGARGITGYRMIDCLFGALAQAVPDKVTADSSGGSTLPTIGGYQKGKAFVFCETFMGNWGAATDHDGQEGVPHMGANQTNVPVEMIEAEYPIRIERYGFVPDTGGPGQFRGGLSLTREYRLLAEEAVLNVRSDKRRYPPHGLFGGGEGHPSTNLLQQGESERLLPVLLTEPVYMHEGDVFRHVMAGGGGNGDPLAREAEMVLEDVLEGKVTVAHAAEAYGVVVHDGPLPEVDQAATEALRARMRGEVQAMAGVE
ncbi:MAG: hydantoinase B/oxoprolinase family protein [Alphaproteobacteria bacterium]|jgi:N-methylhydantoinase B|nr:hydantoinase B/oxoprolinase family protein [Alphaproteobacteria bacterium]